MTIYISIDIIIYSYNPKIRIFVAVTALLIFMCFSTYNNIFLHFLLSLFFNIFIKSSLLLNKQLFDYLIIL